MSSQKSAHTAPLSFSAVYRINPDTQSEFSTFITDYVGAVRAAKPPVLSLSAGVSADETTFAVTAVHLDTDAMEEHLQVVAPFVHRSFQLATVEAITVVGSPGPGLTAALRANGEAGAKVTLIEAAQGFVADGSPAR